jgi:hypothetical protein
MTMRDHRDVTVVRRALELYRKALATGEPSDPIAVLVVVDCEERYDTGNLEFVLNMIDAEDEGKTEVCTLKIMSRDEFCRKFRNSYPRVHDDLMAKEDFAGTMTFVYLRSRADSVGVGTVDVRLD